LLAQKETLITMSKKSDILSEISIFFSFFPFSIPPYKDKSRAAFSSSPAA